MRTRNGAPWTTLEAIFLGFHTWWLHVRFFCHLENFDRQFERVAAAARFKVCMTAVEIDENGCHGLLCFCFIAVKVIDYGWCKAWSSENDEGNRCADGWGIQCYGHRELWAQGRPRNCGVDWLKWRFPNVVWNLKWIWIRGFKCRWNSKI